MTSYFHNSAKKFFFRKSPVLIELKGLNESILRIAKICETAFPRNFLIVQGGKINNIECQCEM